MGYERVVRSGKVLEYYQYERQWIKPKVVSVRKRGTKYRKYHVRSKGNIRRAVSAFRRLVWANLDGIESPAFVTLTMLQELSLKASCVHFRRFIRCLRERHGKSFRYIAVPEFQKRGAVHFHVLIWGLPDYVTKKESSTRYLQSLWLCGFCDCLVTDGHPKIAGYMSKYMSKAMSDSRLGGEKAYYASRNVMRSMSVASNSFSAEALQLIGVDKAPRQVKTFTTQWLGRCVYKQIDIEYANFSVDS